MLFAVVISYGLGLTGARYLAELRIINPERAGRVLVLIVVAGIGAGAISGVGVLAASGFVAERVLLDGSLAWPLILGVPWLVCSSVSLTIHGCLNGLFAFRATAWSQLVDSTAGALLGTAGAWQAGLAGAVMGFAAGAALGCVLASSLLLVYSRELRIVVNLKSVQSAFSESSALVGFWFPSTLAGLFFALANWIGPVLLARRTDGFAELALFGVASYWFNALSMLPNALQRVGTVHQASAFGLKNKAAGAEIHRTSIWFNLALIGLAIVPLGVFSPTILSLFGHQFREGWPTMLICLMTTLSLCFIKPAEQTLNASSRAWLSCRLSALFAAVYVLASLPLTEFGAGGLATARFLAYMIHALAMVAATRSLAASGSPMAVTPETSHGAALAA